MQSSLAAQLAGIRTNNNATILDKSKRKKLHSVSLVYPPKEAASQDFESIYYDCLEAFRELESVDARFNNFANSLFSETSIRFDRLIQSADQAVALNAAIEQFLMLVSGYLHLTLSFRALEWLVRRFQIQVHNTEALLLAALPYHEASEFVRILDIIAIHHLPPTFKFLGSCKTSMHGPSRAALVRVCSRDTTLYDLINKFTLVAISRGLSYDRQLVFWTGVNIMITMVLKEQGETSEAADKVLPPVSEVLVQQEQPAAQVAAYMILAVLATQLRLSGDVLRAATDTLILNWSKRSCTKGLACVSQLVEAQKDIAEFTFSEPTWNALVGTFGSLEALTSEILAQSSRINVESLAGSVVKGCLAYSFAEFPAMVPLVAKVGIPDHVVAAVEQSILKERPLEPALNASCVQFVELVIQRLTPLQVDRLEIALQASVKRPVNDDAALESSEVAEDTVKATAELDIDPSALKKSIIDRSANMEQSTSSSFLETPLSTQDPRAQLWSEAAGLGCLSLDELRQLARVSPEAQLSFVLAVAIGPWPTLSRCAAIRVSAAIITSVLSPSAGGDPSGADYQAVLPFALFLLVDSERRIRKEAAKLIQALALCKPTAKRTPRWNDSHPSLAWLQRTDFQHVVSRLVENLEECIMDPEYVFTAARKAGKAAWCEFLVSCALKTRLPQILWVTLRCLASFKGVPKQISPLLSEWSRPNNQELWKQLCKEAKFPFSGIERVLVAVLRSNDNTAITFLIDVMRSGDSPAMAALAGEHIARMWSDVFRPDTQERLADALVDISADSKISYDARDVLQQVQPLSSALYTKLLNRTTGDSTEGDTSATPLFNEIPKRRRRRSSSFVQLRDGPRDQVAAEAEKHLRRTTLILELLEKVASGLKDTSPLVFALFDVLEELMALGEDSRLPVLYTEELLANCMIALVESLNVQGIKARELSSLKVSVVVSCIRSSPSPQVQNRLLLLIATLAKLCPDVVLHGVMPIFTFMGANTVRLDNDFSAHVIEQTIEQVIPALVAAGDKHEEIEMALMSFVAAFPHVPRHRRNTLFGALIRTLGPAQSLYKLLLLFGQRYADIVTLNTSTRTSHSLADAKALIHFSTPFLRHFPPAEQVRAMSSYVRFIVAQSSDKDDSRFGLLRIKEALRQSTSSPLLRNSLFEFLARTVGETDSSAGSQPLRIQVGEQGDSLSADEWALATDMIDALLIETSLHQQERTNDGTSDNRSAAEELLVKVLEMLPIEKFITIVKPLVSPTNERVLSLISTKFKYERKDDDVTLSAAREISDHIVDLIGKNPTSVAIDSVESLFGKFGSSLRESELRLMGTIVGQSGLLNDDIDVVISSILAINTICQKLGAATYGFFPRIFPVLCEKVQRAQDQKRATRVESADVASGLGKRLLPDAARMEVDGEEDEEEDDEIQLATFALFAGLVRQMPRFMAPEAPAILNLVLSSQISAASRTQLLQVLDDKIDAHTMLTALPGAFPSVLKGGIPAVEMFFTTLDSVVDKATKRDLASEVSTLTGMLLQCFAVRQSVSDLNFVNQVEAKAIECGISIVLSLNDRAFRPQFRRIVVWGFENHLPSRQIAVLKFVNRILGQLKGVVTNYFGYLLEDACSILEQGNSADPVVRKLVLQTLITSFTYDQDDFWQSPVRFDRVSAALIGQLVTEPMTHGQLVVKALTSLALTSSPPHRKYINETLTQLIVASAPVTQKVWTIKVFSSLYRRLGEEWMANLPQLVPMIAELLDDSDESVELETRRSLVPVIESVLGESLDRYLA